MTWEQLSLFTDEELGIQPPKEIPKTVAIQMHELRESIADEIFQQYLFEGSKMADDHTLMSDRERAVWEACIKIVRGYNL